MADTATNIPTNFALPIELIENNNNNNNGQPFTHKVALSSEAVVVVVWLVANRALFLPSFFTFNSSAILSAATDAVAFKRD